MKTYGIKQDVSASFENEPTKEQIQKVLEVANFFSGQYEQQEEDFTRRFFDLETVLEFQKQHKVEVLRGADFQYIAYIDGEAYGPALTFLGALVEGMRQYGVKMSHF